MTELKTLKDFEEKYKGERISKEGYAINQKLLAIRQEAIKWIKEEIRIWESRHTIRSKKGKVTDVPTIKRWMDRFNITEEDLK